MGLKEEVYAAIRADFETNGSESFLLDYLKREKERRLQQYGRQPDWEKKQRDPYVLLLLRYQRIRGDGDSGGKALYLRELASLLERNPKLRPGIQAQRILELRTGMDEIFRSKYWNRNEYGRLLTLLKTQPPEFGLEELGLLHQDISFRLLVLEAKALLYDAIDAGKKETGKADAPASGRKPKVDRMLDLFCDYLRWQGISTLSEAAGPGQGEAAEETTEDWERLYALLNSGGLSQEERRNAQRLWLPVRVDPETGASIYIIGKRRFPRRKAIREKTRGLNCCCLGFYANDLVIADEEPAEIACLWSDGDEALEGMFYPNIREALVWYGRVLRPRAKRSFLEENGPAPRGCPEMLKAYFSVC